MTALPRRFPKQRLHASLTELESRVTHLMDETQQKIDESEDRGLEVVTEKLSQRFNGLDDIRLRINEARLIAYELP